jgi:adenosine deaminase
VSGRDDAADRSNAAMRDFIQALPKTETHLHVEGALPYELLTRLDAKRWPPEPEFRQRSYRYATFPDFERILLDHALPWFDSVERYHEAAKVIFAGHLALNVRYVETSFHLPAVRFLGVPGPEIIAAIQSAAPAGLEVRIFVGMLRTDLGGEMRPVIDQLHTWKNLAGVDLHGVETLPTHPDTAAVWAQLRAAGKVTKCHAGEFGGAARVREAIEVLGVTRIQHGVQAVQDPAVVRLAADLGVTFDVCPISNVGLRVVPSIAAHPLRQLRAAGVRCTVSTDDPLCFANTITDEYATLAAEGGYTRAELAAIARSGWEVADVTPEMRRRAFAEIDRLVA